MADHYNDRSNDNEYHIPTARGQPIKNEKKKTILFNRKEKKLMKATHNKETNKEDTDETMDTSYNEKEDEDERMTLDSKTSTPDQTNHGQLIESDDETETA